MVKLQLIKGSDGCSWIWADLAKIAAFVANFGLTSWLIATGCLESTLGTSDLALRLLLISTVTALVELAPFGDDNYTVPGCAAIMAALILH